MYLYMNSFIRLKSTFSITNMFLLINRIILKLEFNPLTPKIVPQNQYAFKSQMEDFHQFINP